MIGPDPYADPDTGVLHNPWGIVDELLLDRRIAAITALRDARLAMTRVEGHYDLAHLCEFHRFLFDGIFDWAGNTRTVDISRDIPFCQVQNLASSAARIFYGLVAREQLQGLNRSAFVAALAKFLGDLNALHPFREGNGRTQRAFMRQLAADAGYHLDWTQVAKDENDEASREAMFRPDAPLLASLLDRIVS